MSEPINPALTVLTSNSTQPLLDALGALFEAECGHRVSVQCDSAKVMLQRIREGLQGDLVVLGAEAVDALAKSKIVEPNSVWPFARSRVGVGVKAGTPHPDISSVDAFRRTLLHAASIAHTVHGASGMYVPVLLERLGIADEMKHKTVTRPGGFIGRVVVSGEAFLRSHRVRPSSSRKDSKPHSGNGAADSDGSSPQRLNLALPTGDTHE